MARTLLLFTLLLASSATSAQPVPFVSDFSSVLVQGADRSIIALWSDYDGDGDLDLLVTDVEGKRYDNLYRNDGEGAFMRLRIKTSNNPAAITNAGAIGDFNNDGFLDLASGSLNGGTLYLNKGDGGGEYQFRYIRSSVDNFPEVRSVNAADYDGDGALDLVLIRRFGSQNMLIRNDGLDGVPQLSGDVYADGGDSNSACWGDANNDGLPDLYVANETTPSRYYVNQGGTLIREGTQPITQVGSGASGCGWGDSDNDGDLDLVVTREGTGGGGNTHFFRNDDGNFAATQTDDRFLWAVGNGWGDVDNDGDLDLVVSYQNGPGVTLFLNDGTGAFEPFDFGISSFATVLTLVDDDEDGDLDLFVVNGDYLVSQQNHLYRNTTDGAGNWLQVDLHRSDGPNRFGLGALVYAYATIGGEARTLLRPMLSNSGRRAQTGYRLHFGLGDAAVVDSLVVEWPQGVDEERTVLYDVAVNQMLTVDGGEAASSGVAEVASRSTVETSSLVAEASVAFAVEGVHPNPSHRDFTLTVRSSNNDPVRVEVLDVLGRRVRLLEAEGAPGNTVRLRWDGRSGEGDPVAAGLYLLRVQQGADEIVSRVTLLR